MVSSADLRMGFLSGTVVWCLRGVSRRFKLAAMRLTGMVVWSSTSSPAWLFSTWPCFGAKRQDGTSCFSVASVLGAFLGASDWKRICGAIGSDGRVAANCSAHLTSLVDLGQVPKSHCPVHAAGGE